ncbi:MAG: glutaredoxin [Candidatus Omnitrophota bacterium]
MKLELYYKPACPYCKKVLQYIDRNHIQGIELKDKSAHPEFEKELITIGGKPQVPCLMIDGEPLYESDDIIQWLGEHCLEN